MKQAFLPGCPHGAEKIGNGQSILNEEGTVTNFLGSDNYFLHAPGDRSGERFALTRLMVNRHVRVVDLERSSLGIPHRTLPNWMAHYREAGPGSFHAEASHQKPRVMTPEDVAECANLLAAGYRPAAIARQVGIGESTLRKAIARKHIVPCATIPMSQAWRERPLEEIPYVFLDARYERIREGGQIVDCAVLVAVGVTATGHRRVLGVSVALSEAEVHWRQLLSDLIRRGLRGVKLIISDDHAGLKTARRATLPSVPWQRCQFHLQQNAQAYVPRLDLRKEVALRIRSIFNAPDKAEAQRLLSQAVERWQKEAPKLADWAEANLPEGFAVFDYPSGHRTRLRTTNGLERINREIKRRTRVASIFPNAASCLRLVSALLAECDEEWRTAKIYLNMKA